ncbi:hypothetical protein ACFU7Y_02860 [Kitasatospora sp. NPDC057542]|uniref:hypothetical protein n=1 Tax=Kitasatospora sp. NPDC057542 TaxID=3346162 RepID=UPI0036CCE520
MKVTIQFDTEQDSYTAIDRMVREAFGLAPSPVRVKPVPLAEGEVWRDPDDNFNGPWTEDDVRRWVHELPEVLDVVVVLHRLCSTPGVWTTSTALGASLFPDEPKPGHRVGVAIRRTVKAGHRIDRRSGPFERDTKGFRSRVPSEVARIVLDELQRHPLHAQALANTAQHRTTA